jgi:glyoxylase-like metal-dependent hydrolase (beta-lactamase superfamily II)
VAPVVESFDHLGITRISRWIFNCYLIHDGGAGAPVVIDAGLPGVADDVAEALAGRGLSLEAVSAVCATHAHSDHVAGAPTLSSRAGVPVHLPQRSRDYLQGAKPRTPGLAASARIWPTVFDQPFDGSGLGGLVRGSRVAGYGTPAGMKWPPGQQPEYFSDGDCLPGAPDWQVIATPGHTDDSMAFWNPHTQVLLSGDAVLSFDGNAWITPETVDDVAHAATADRLGQLDVRHLLPGHGRPVHGEALTATALRPGDGPRGLRDFWQRLTRGLRGPAGEDRA